MEFISLNGYVGDTSYISFTIKGGKNGDSIGDQVWISKCGTKMEVTELADKSVLRECAELFKGNDRRAFRGAMLRMGVDF